MIELTDIIRALALQVALLKGDTTAQALLQQDSFRCVARTVYGEARGEGLDGMALVVQSMINRHQSNGRSSCKMARKSYDGYRHWQFKNPRQVDASGYETVQLLSIAVIMGGYDLGDCSDVTHFINPAKIKRYPAWASRENRICRVGNHVAYRVVQI